MKNLKKILIIIPIILIITGCQNNTKTPKSDYYDYINKDNLKTLKLKKDEYTKSTFTKAQDKVDKQTNNIIEKLKQQDENSNINILFNQLIDIDTRNKENITPLEKYITKINSSNNIKEYINNAIDIENDLSIPIFTNIQITKDFKDSHKNIVYLIPITYDFGTSSDYYANADYMSYKALIKQYGLKILKTYGYNTKQARELSTNITNMYNTIACISLQSKDLEDISKYYNIINKEDLQKIYSNLDIDYYLNKKNIPSNQKLSIVDINNYKAMNKYLTEDNLEVLKQSTILKILETYAPYLSKNYNDIIYELSSKLTNTKNNNTINKQANDTIKKLFTYDIDKYYENNYFQEENKQYLQNMTNDILNFYKKDLPNVSWLSSKTKQKALKKLEKMTVNIGLVDANNDYSKEYNLNSQDSLIQNIIKIQNIINKHELAKLQSSTTSQEISQTTVNAYYNPNDNSINLPISTINLFAPKNTYYQNLGTIGMIIAHEITHAFDTNGSKFDEDGNLKNWWTKEDRQKFNELEKKVIKYYNKYEPVAGEEINGKKTVNENIADLKAVSTISQIALSKNATNKEMKEMYTSFAELWANVSTDEYQKLLLLNDTHAPAKYRVNATLSSTDAFYKTYNLTPFDKMYLKPNARIKVW